MNKKAETKKVAIYVRVSTTKQDMASQIPELERWASTQDAEVAWFREAGVSGKSMDRPEWNKIEKLIFLGKLETVVVWRLDRLGRTASGLTKLFDDLQAAKVNLVSLRDGVTLNSSAGRLMANVLASVAQFETEVRAERVAAGQAKARAAGKKWGGSKPGVRKKVTPDHVKAITLLRKEGVPIAKIAKMVQLGKMTILSVLREQDSVVA